MVKHNYRAIKTLIRVSGMPAVWEVRWYRMPGYSTQVGKVVQHGREFVAVQNDGTQIGSPSPTLKEARQAVIDWHAEEHGKKMARANQQAGQKRKETRNRYNAALEQTQRMIKAQDGKCVWGLEVFTYDDRKRDENRGEAPFLRAFIFERGAGQFHAMYGWLEAHNGEPGRLRFERTDFENRAELFEYIRRS